MGAGFQSFFDNGLFQIDADIRVATMAYRVDYPGPFGTLNTPFVATPYYFDLGVPAGVGSLFFSCDTPIFIALMSKVGTTWRFRCSTTATIRIYGFADQNIPDSGSGFQTLSATGVITFDSNAKFMRPIDIVREAGPGTSRNWPGPAGNYAAGIGHYPKRSVGASLAGVPYWVQMAYGVSVGPSTYAVGENPILSRPVGGGGTPPPPASPAMAAPTMMCLDVTAY